MALPPPRRRSSLRTSFSVLTAAPEARDEDIERLFRKLDRDGSGHIDAAELLDGLRTLGVPGGRGAVEKLLARIDLNDDGHVSLSEFKAFVQSRTREIESTWHTLCSGKTHVSSNDVRIGIERLGLTISDQQLRNVMADLDRDGDGSVSFAEFQHCLMLLPDVNPRAVFDHFVDVVPIDMGGGFDSVVKDVHRGADADTAEKAHVKLTAGAIAGAVSRTVSAPLERVRARMQANTRRSMLSVCRDIWSEGGPRGFMRGNTVHCVKIAPETAIRTVLFDVFKQALASDPDNVEVHERFVSGAAAGAGGHVLVYPLEMVKTRITVSSSNAYQSAVDCLSTTVRNEGWRALYKGLTPSLLGMVPYAGIELSANSFLAEHVSGLYATRNKEPDISAMLGCGMVRAWCSPHSCSLIRVPGPQLAASFDADRACHVPARVRDRLFLSQLSSAFAMTFTYPLNVVRTRLQMSGTPGMPEYASVTDCLRRTVETEGALGLYRGFLPNMIKVLPAASVSCAVYEQLNGLGQRRIKERTMSSSQMSQKS